MTEPAGSAWMSSYAGLFETKTTITPVAAAGMQQLLGADSRRWYVEFSGFAGLTTNPKVYPHPPPPGLLAVIAAPGWQQYKFRDCPSMVTREWWGFNDGTIQWVITEVLYWG